MFKNPIFNLIYRFLSYKRYKIVTNREYKVKNKYFRNIYSYIYYKIITIQLVNLRKTPCC
jgi:hypothetical protein